MKNEVQMLRLKKKSSNVLFHPKIFVYNEGEEGGDEDIYIILQILHIVVLFLYDYTKTNENIMKVGIQLLD